MRKTLLAIPLLLTAASVQAGPFDCSEKAARRVVESASGASSVRIVGKAGELRVTGQRGATQVEARGTACTSDRDFLKEVRLDIRREGSEIIVEAIIPERVAIFDWTSASLDFEVTLPATLPVEVVDGSGELTISNVGDLEVTDGSGEIDVRGVNGNVRVKDGSGQMSIEDVTGSVEIIDGSGSIEVRKVGRDVRVKLDGSGSIDVAEVRGNFTVDRDGSGGIDYERVSGRVNIPEKD